jgi:hypothetical protein
MVADGVARTDSEAAGVVHDAHMAHEITYDPTEIVPEVPGIEYFYACNDCGATGELWTNPEQADFERQQHVYDHSGHVTKLMKTD